MTPGEFRLYADGGVHFVDLRVNNPVSFAHVTDLHLPPYSPQTRPKQYRRAIEWWDVDCEHPNDVLPGLLDEIQSAGVDFVFFGGDVLDYYDADTANRVVQLCRERSLDYRFQLGNHDFETPHIRYVTHENDRKARSECGARLCKHWNMPGLYYSFDRGRVRFIVLDTPYEKIEGGWGGVYDEAQVDWLIEQLHHDGPIVIFHHIPFKLSSLEFRLRLVWNGVAGWVVDDGNSRRLLSAIGGCGNVLGTFTGHSHIRSEDPIAQTCQFMTAAGYMRQWRLVTIDKGPPPKSLRIAGEPEVDLPDET